MCSLYSDEVIHTWVVVYKDMEILCKAKNARSAKHNAWIKYCDAYPTTFIDFLKGINKVYVKDNSNIEEVQQ
jgi:hypothetical protein